MLKVRIGSLVLLSACATAVLGLTTQSSLAGNGNCDCYYSSDCEDSEKQYCNYQSACTRHCVPAADPDDDNIDGATAECDGDPENDGPGRCVDNEPTPAVGTDGDGDQCAKNDPSDTTTYKIRDGNCTWRKKKQISMHGAETISNGIYRWSLNLADLIDNGGGQPMALNQFLAANEIGGRRALREIEDMVMNMASLSLGQAFSQADPSFPRGFVAVEAFNAVCARELVLATGEGFADEILLPGNNGLVDRLSLLSQECREFANSRTTACLFPHPRSHGHDYPYIDAVDCIAGELEAAARSLRTPARPEHPPQGNR